MRRTQFTLKTLLWLMVVMAAYFAGRLHGRDELQSLREDSADTIDYYKQKSALRERWLREALDENTELRERLGLPLDPSDTDTDE
jgi:hypothetical protein